MGVMVQGMHQPHHLMIAKGGLSAADILKLYVEQGPAIFDQEHGGIENWVRQKLPGLAHLLVTKRSSEPLRRALEGVIGRRKLGESRTRLVIPACIRSLNASTSTRPRTIRGSKPTTGSRRSTPR